MSEAILQTRLGGDLVVREPLGDPHAFAIELAHEALRTAFDSEWRVRVLLPVALDEESEPEPDISVAPSPMPHGSEAKPSRLALVVEIAESNLAIERDFKGSYYARAPVPEYWIVNLSARVLEVYREPGPDAFALYGWAYRSVERLRSGAHVSPLAAPTARIAVTDLLP